MADTRGSLLLPQGDAQPIAPTSSMNEQRSFDQQNRPTAKTCSRSLPKASIRNGRPRKRHREAPEDERPNRRRAEIRVENRQKECHERASQRNLDGLRRRVSWLITHIESDAKGSLWHWKCGAAKQTSGRDGSWPVGAFVTRRRMRRWSKRSLRSMRLWLSRLHRPRRVDL